MDCMRVEQEVRQESMGCDQENEQTTGVWSGKATLRKSKFERGISTPVDNECEH